VPIWRAFCGGFECYYGAMRLVLDPFRLLHFPCRLPEPTAARRDRVSSRREPCSARTARRQSAALRRVYSGPLPLVRLADKRAARLTLLKVVAGLGRCVRSRASIPSAVPLSQTNRPLLPAHAPLGSPVHWIGCGGPAIPHPASALPGSLRHDFLDRGTEFIRYHRGRVSACPGLRENRSCYAMVPVAEASRAGRAVGYY